MSESTHIADEPETDREIVTVRIFPFPPEAVFQAFEEPSRLAAWWGPEGFSSTFEAFDFRPGGAWHFVMHGPDGSDYPNQSVFTEIEKPERLVLEHLSGHWFQATFTFEDLGAETRLTFRQLFASAADCEPIRAFVTVANEQNFDRLGAELKRGS